ncbi:MAG: hypothetical protein U5R31_06400 [Acidimicrobiia bacterium]|nr:hypothetical protein [Acidimicrobiia bacterium]
MGVGPLVVGEGGDPAVGQTLTEVAQRLPSEDRAVLVLGAVVGHDHRAGDRRVRRGTLGKPHRAVEGKGSSPTVASVSANAAGTPPRGR